MICKVSLNKFELLILGLFYCCNQTSAVNRITDAVVQDVAKVQSFPQLGSHLYVWRRGSLRLSEAGGCGWGHGCVFAGTFVSPLSMIYVTIQINTHKGLFPRC